MLTLKHAKLATWVLLLSFCYSRTMGRNEELIHEPTSLFRFNFPCVTLKQQKRRGVMLLESHRSVCSQHGVTARDVQPLSSFLGTKRPV